MPGKRVQFDEETWQALGLLGRDSMKTFQEFADEAFADLLTKHGRSTDLKTALRRSLPERERRPPAARSRVDRVDARGRNSCAAADPVAEPAGKLGGFLV
jgi:hypothetical protein